MFLEVLVSPSTLSNKLDDNISHNDMLAALDNNLLFGFTLFVDMYFVCSKNTILLLLSLLLAQEGTKR